MPDQRRRLRPPDDAPRRRYDVVTNAELPWQLQNLADHTPPGQHVGDLLAQAARRIRKLEGELAAAKGLVSPPNAHGTLCATCGTEVENQDIVDISLIRFGEHLCKEHFMARKSGVPS